VPNGPGIYSFLFRHHAEFAADVEAFLGFPPPSLGRYDSVKGGGAGNGGPGLAATSSILVGEWP